jgi:hypothetical protein
MDFKKERPVRSKFNSDRKALFLTATSVKNMNPDEEPESSVKPSFKPSRTKYSSFYRSKSQNMISGTQFKQSNTSNFYSNFGGDTTEDISSQHKRARSISKKIYRHLQINVDPYSKTHAKKSSHKLKSIV